jgi:hypothetical protein
VSRVQEKFKINSICSSFEKVGGSGIAYKDARKSNDKSTIIVHSVDKLNISAKYVACKHRCSQIY